MKSIDEGHWCSPSGAGDVPAGAAHLGNGLPAQNDCGTGTLDRDAGFHARASMIRLKGVPRAEWPPLTVARLSQLYFEEAIRR